MRSRRHGRREAVLDRPGIRWLVRRFSDVPPDRGDVPGWVMIAVMSAALVVAIMVPFRATVIPAMTAAIQDMFGQAR